MRCFSPSKTKKTPKQHNKAVGTEDVVLSEIAPGEFVSVSVSLTRTNDSTRSENLYATQVVESSPSSPPSPSSSDNNNTNHHHHHPNHNESQPSPSHSRHSNLYHPPSHETSVSSFVSFSSNNLYSLYVPQMPEDDVISHNNFLVREDRSNSYMPSSDWDSIEASPGYSLSPFSSPRVSRIVSTTSPVTSPRKPHQQQQQQIIGGIPQLTWNERFQRIVSMDDNLAKFSKCERLACEFVETATTYARIIVSELCLPDHAKSLKPTKIGGVAGGLKYVVQDMVFKFALDTVITENPTRYLYGDTFPDNEAAMKAAGKELVSMEAHWIALVPGIHYPLMCIIDYKGYRVTAIAYLPINQNTLLYGSGDGGRTVHADDPVLNEKMKLAAQRSNICGHRVGDKEIWGPGDIEGHKGEDGRYYVIDFARFMPPEDPSRFPNSGTRSVFSKFLRYELIRFHAGSNPACSDAYTKWDTDINDRPAHNENVTNLTNILYEKVVPAFAQHVEDDYAIREFKWDDEMTMTTESIFNVLNVFYGQQVHKVGICMRHLGAMRAACNLEKEGGKSASRILFNICLSRLAKNEVRRNMRDVMTSGSINTSSDSPFHDIFLDYLRKLLDPEYWTETLKLKLLNRFPQVLSADESSSPASDLRTTLFEPRLVVVHLMHMLGVKMTDKALRTFMRSPQKFVPMFVDVQTIDPKSKNTHFIFLTNAMRLYLEGKKQIEDLSEISERDRPYRRQACIRILRGANDKFSCMACRVPFCPFLPCRWANVHLERAKLSKNKLKHLNKAQTHYQTSINNLPTPVGYNLWAKCLQEIAIEKRSNGDEEGALEADKLAEEKLQHHGVPDFAVGILDIPSFFMKQEEAIPAASATSATDLLS